MDLASRTDTSHERIENDKTCKVIFGKIRLQEIFYTILKSNEGNKKHLETCIKIKIKYNCRYAIKSLDIMATTQFTPNLNLLDKIFIFVG